MKINKLDPGLRANAHAPALEAMCDPLVPYEKLPKEAKDLIDRSVEYMVAGLQSQGRTVSPEDVVRYKEASLRLFRQEIITSYVNVEEIND